MLLNCGVGEDSWESLGLQEIQPVHPKGDQSWIFIGRTDAEAKTPILLPPDAKDSLEGLMLKLKLQYFDHLMRRTDWFEKTLMLGKIEGRRRRGWDGWMASPTLWTWVWVGSESWWWTEKPGVLQSMGSQRVGYDWANKLNWTEPLV